MSSYEGTSVCTPFDQPWNFRKKFHRPKYRSLYRLGATVMNNSIVCDFVNNWEWKFDNNDFIQHFSQKFRRIWRQSTFLKILKFIGIDDLRITQNLPNLKKNSDEILNRHRHHYPLQILHNAFPPLHKCLLNFKTPFQNFHSFPNSRIQNQTPFKLRPL